MEELCITNNVFDLGFWSLQFCFPGKQTFELYFVKNNLFKKSCHLIDILRDILNTSIFLKKSFLKMKHSKRKPGLNSSILKGGVFFGNSILKLFCISIFSIVIILFVILSVTQAWRRCKPTILMYISNCKTGVLCKFLLYIYSNSQQWHVGILSAN